ncbi:MAG: hypothetical protein AAF686_00850 [Pseudomonadota bacterium]
MTTYISRYFDSTQAALDAKFELTQRRNVSPRIVQLYRSAESLVDALTKDHVEEKTARTYLDKMTSSGGAVLLVRAGFKPLNVAQTFRTVTEQMGAVDMGNLKEEVYIKQVPSKGSNLIPGNPLLLTKERDPDFDNYHMANWPIPLIKRRVPYSDSLFPRHARMASWPVPLLYRDAVGEDYKPFTESIFPRHARMASWPIGLLAPERVRYGRFPFGLLASHRVRYGRFPFGLLASHKRRYGRFPFDLLVPGGRRMANWPFPLLINGKQHTNSLAPRDIRYGRFPFDLLVRHDRRYGRFPFGFLVSHNRRYGRFPFGLLASDKRRYGRFPFGLLAPHDRRYGRFPFGLLVPGHKYMANWIWPHTTEKSN